MVQRFRCAIDNRVKVGFAPRRYGQTYIVNLHYVASFTCFACLGPNWPPAAAEESAALNADDSDGGGDGDDDMGGGKRCIVHVKSQWGSLSKQALKRSMSTIKAGS